VVAAVIVGEAGGEGKTGMLAVAGVIKNRMRAGRTAYAVVSRPAQFDAYTTPILKKKTSLEDYVIRAKKHPNYAYALELASKLENGTCQDITSGATHFYSGGTEPYWAKVFEFRVTIGGHKFYKEV
jgi:spore germination cell wall hydrolase CwlJ-like protein